MAKKILVAPLDWGLGHATRCIPIIRELVKKGHEVILATDGRAYDLLAAEFPDLKLLRLRGYHPVYPETNNMGWVMVRQAPKIFWAIAKEGWILAKWITEYNLDAIISDNRFGLSTKRKPTVFITHQINIPVPANVRWGRRILNWFNHRYIKRFNRVWVPDWPDGRSLSGDMSSIDQKKIPHRYIGPVSRFVKLPGQPKKYDVLVLLSGPEPQRSFLEEKIRRQLEFLDKKVLLVQGVTHTRSCEAVSDKLDVCTYMTSGELAEALASSNMVIARGGYTTVMDLVAIEKQALFVPTPGQSEQEYLAKELTAKHYFYSVTQDTLSLANDLAIAESYFPPSISTDAHQLNGFSHGNMLEKELDDWLSVI